MQSCNTLAERNRSIKEGCEGIVQKYEEVVRIVAGFSVNERNYGNDDYLEHMTGKKAKTVLQEMYGKIYLFLRGFSSRMGECRGEFFAKKELL